MGMAAKSGMEGGARNPRVPTIRMGLIYALYFVLEAASDPKVRTLSTADWFLNCIVLIRHQKFHST